MRVARQQPAPSRRYVRRSASVAPRRPSCWVCCSSVALVPPFPCWPLPAPAVFSAASVGPVCPAGRSAAGQGSPAHRRSARARAVTPRPTHRRRDRRSVLPRVGRDQRRGHRRAADLVDRRDHRGRRRSDGLPPALCGARSAMLFVVSGATAGRRRNRSGRPTSPRRVARRGFGACSPWGATVTRQFQHVRDLGQRGAGQGGASVSRGQRAVVADQCRARLEMPRQTPRGETAAGQRCRRRW